jgi:hypothetical protein
MYEYVTSVLLTVQFQYIRYGKYHTFKVFV